MDVSELAQEAASAVQGAARSAAATTAGAALDWSITFPSFSSHIQTDSIVVAVSIAATVGAVSLTVVYFSRDLIGREIRDAVKEVLDRVLGGERNDRDVGDTNRGSLLVDLHCHTAESFLQFLEDYESGQVKRDLKKELLKIEIAVEELSIKIKNEEEVEKHKKKLKSAGIEWRTIEGKVQIINKGREKEINAIKSSLVEKNRGIVSIIGGPGFAKSTIAVEVAHCLSEKHKFHVFFSYLSKASTVPEAVRRLCRGIGIEPGEDPKSSLMVWLKNMKPGKVVLVLDNIEQLLEGEVKSEFLDLLRSLRKDSNQHLQIITTSRKPFRVSDLENECCSVEVM